MAVEFPMHLRLRTAILHLGVPSVAGIPIGSISYPGPVRLSFSFGPPFPAPRPSCVTRRVFWECAAKKINRVSYSGISISGKRKRKPVTQAVVLTASALQAFPHALRLTSSVSCLSDQSRRSRLDSGSFRLDLHSRAACPPMQPSYGLPCAPAGHPTGPAVRSKKINRPAALCVSRNSPKSAAKPGVT